MCEELKMRPCPFCGGEAVLEEHYITRYWSIFKVRCKDDECLGYHVGRSVGSKDEAIKMWNTRAGSDARLVWNEQAGCLECEVCGAKFDEVVVSYDD